MKDGKYKWKDVAFWIRIYGLKITPSLPTELQKIVNFDTMMSKCIKKKMNAFANLRFL